MNPMVDAVRLQFAIDLSVFLCSSLTAFGVPTNASYCIYTGWLRHKLLSIP